MSATTGSSRRARLGFAALSATVIFVVGAKAATGGGAPTSALAASPASSTSSTGDQQSGSSAATSGSGSGSGTGTDSGTGSSSSGSSSDSSSSSSSSDSSSSGSSSTGSSSSGSSSSSGTRTVTGDAVDTRFGAVQVQVVLSGTKITDVVVLQQPDRERRDIEINEQAVPILRQEVLAAQSAEIDVVSGASYTSYGYAESVQSALDKAGV